MKERSATLQNLVEILLRTLLFGHRIRVRDPDEVDSGSCRRAASTTMDHATCKTHGLARSRRSLGRQARSQHVHRRRSRLHREPAMFFLATADAEGGRTVRTRGATQVSYGWSAPARWRFRATTATACSGAWANVLVNPFVGMLFIDFDNFREGSASTAELPRRQGRPLGEFEGAQLVVRVEAEAIFPNCPRYIHRMAESTRSNLHAD